MSRGRALDCPPLRKPSSKARGAQTFLFVVSPRQGRPPPSAASGSSRGWSNTSRGAAPSSPITDMAATVGLGAEGSLWTPQTGDADDPG